MRAMRAMRAILQHHGVRRNIARILDSSQKLFVAGEKKKKKKKKKSRKIDSVNARDTLVSVSQRIRYAPEVSLSFLTETL